MFGMDASGDFQSVTEEEECSLSVNESESPLRELQKLKSLRSPAEEWLWMVQSRLVSQDRLIRHHSSNDWEIRRIVEALHFLEETMPLLQPSVEDFACILLKCRKGKKLQQALCLHAYMRQCGLEVHASLGNHLLSVLVEVGSMCHAQQVFDRLVYRDECSWSSLITGYVKCGESCHALTLYQKMQEHDSLHPSGYTVVALLKACAALKDLERGRTLHLEIASKGLLERDVFVGSTLVDMYAKCGSLVQAQEVFDKLLVRDVVLWTALIGGYTEHGHGEEALNCVRQMQHEGISPDAFTIVCSLKACGIIGATEKGQEIHAEAVRKGLEMELLVGNSLVDVYARCGSLATAQDLFNKLPVRDVVSWNALITGYVEHGGDDEALYSFEQMQCEGISRDAVTLVCSLKACGSIGATIKGQEIHAEIASKGLERDILLGNTLVHMYAKCGLLAEAQKVFDKLSVRDVVSWTALIAGYVEHGCGDEALDCFEQMQHDHISLNVVTFVCCLKACGSIGAIVKGQEIHAEIVRKGLERELLAGNTLVDIYAKCGMLATAQEVFDKLLVRDVVSWNALIAGYVEHGRGEEALLCFEQMQHDGIFLNAVTFFYIVNGCSSLGATVKGQEIHSEIAKKGLEGDLLISNTLVDMYAKCGFLIEAQAVFDKLPVRDLVSWTALLTGYAEHGHDEEALNCFKQMQDDGISMNAVTSVCILKACGSIGAIVRSREIHAEIARKGFERELLIGSTLVDMYAKCGLLGEAQEVFDKLPVRDVVLWTALMAGYANHGRGEEALDCFKQMQHDSITMNAVALICSLKCCASIGATVKGLEIHAEIARKGLEKQLLIGSTLVDMYAKCGLLAEAQEVFDKLAVRDMVPWTALMAGYTEHGCGEGALMCFGQMQHNAISLNAVTFVCGLKACGSIKATAKGQEIHAEITKKGMETELLVGNTLVDMYAKSGLLATARKVFDELPARDVVSWNALIAGYAEHGHGEEALDCFEQMHYEGISLNAITFVCSLKACGSIGATIKGRETHAEMVKKGLERDLLLGNILIDMYAKCGLLTEAREVFDKLPVQDVISWNALMAGYALLGESENVFRIFDRMIGVHIKPNLVTFVSLLNACSHAGLVKKGQMCFETITNDYGFIPTLEHYTCMVDLFGRAGHIDKAVAMIRKMPLHPDTVVWHTVLGACRKWGNVELARHAFEHAVRFGEKVVAAYVCMSNIYADAALQEEADKVGQ